jgi:hypothetical protein
MNPLLLLGGLAAARRSFGIAVNHTARNFVACAILVCTGTVALGFFTAGGFLYMASIWGAVTASMTVAAVYAVLGGIFFLAVRAPRAAHILPKPRPLSALTPQGDMSTVVNRELPASVIAVGLLAIAGYFAGRSMTPRR